MDKIRLLSRLFVSITLSLVAALILVTSVFRSAQVRYAFELDPKSQPQVLGDDTNISYQLPYPGKINPGSILWPFKVVRDKAWLSITTNPLKNAEISLLLADKRMASAQISFESGDYNTGIMIAKKAELYLDISLQHLIQADEQNMETAKMFERLANASLKHREVLEENFTQAPDDAKPILNTITDYSRNVYTKCMQKLNEKGIVPPDNPFDNP